MADQRITQLNELSGAGVAANDVLAIVDISGSETKKVTVQNLVGATFGLAASGAIDLIKLNQASATKLGTAAIADDAITYTKIQNVTATDRLLGRQTAGAGAVEEIICTAAGRALLDDTNAAAQRTTLELGTGNSVVFSSVTANITAASATISGGTITGITDLAVADGGTGASTAADARTNLGVAIGTDIVGYDAGLQSIANLLTQADRGIYTTASDTYATFVFTAAGRALLDDADAAAQRTTLGLGALATLDEITSAQITNLTISSVDIADAAVTSAKLGLNAGDLAGTLIANGGIGTTQLANTAVTNDKITDGTISFVKLNLNAGDIPGDRIATGGIGTTQIANDAVVSTKIADNTVSYAKIQDVTSTDRLLGRSSVGAGDIEEIVCTSSGRALLVGASAAAQRLTLGLGSIATLDAITSAEITDLTVNTADLAENSVTIAKLNLNAGELPGNVIANSGITATQLGTAAVETAKIQDRAVTYTKIQNTTTDDIIIGRVSAGAGGLEEITCTAVGRALIDDVTVADQRATLGLGTLATQNGTFSGTHSGTSSGTNTGDQTITLTGAVTGSGTAGITTTLSNATVTNDKIADSAVTYTKIQNVTTTDRLLGRQTAGAGNVEEIVCTAAGRALLNDASAADQRTTLGLGTLALSDGTWVDGSSFSGTSSGTNTGDQTITLSGAVVGTGTGSFATTLSSDIVASVNLQAESVTTAKLHDDSVNEDKLGDQSTCIVSNASPTGNGAYVGQGWFNSSTNLAYRWNGGAWAQEAGIQSITITDSTPLSVVVSNPDAFTANLTLSLDTQGANLVFVGPTSGADAAPTFRALVPADLPDATTSAKGIIQAGTGLSVTSGTLNHNNSVTGATKSGITFDAQGHITAAVDLVAGDIPDLDAAKITTGAFTSDRIAAGAITASKLANKSTASIGETLPAAAFTGQLHFNPLDKNFFLWDGNVWQSIGISAGAIILAGTYDANTNQIASVTNDGTAVGLSVGTGLPSSSSTNSNYYLVVSEAGTGTSPAPTVALAPPDLLLSTGSEWLEIDVSSTYTAQTANNVAFSPAANLGSTNVQSALEEVSNECRDVDNMTGGVLDVIRGGTNIASYAKGDLIAASATTTLNKLAVGANGYILSANSSETTGLEWIENKVGTVTEVTVAAPLGVTNGTTTPALTISTGTTSAVGVLQLTDGVTSSSTTTAATPNGVKTAYDLAADAMPKAGGTFTGQVLISNTGSLVFEGATDNAFETTLALADPTADQVITLPDNTGTVALTSQLDDGTF